ncbi:MAG: SDR family NAD(P)-dependent oxidoreductase [Acidimicrobiia bacterium]
MGATKAEGRVAVVTGAGRGIGAAVCRRLAADGLSIVAADIDAQAANAIADEVGGVAHRVDVTNPDDVQAMASTLDRCDVLVNNAGVWRFAPLSKATPEDIRAVLDTNVLGTVLCTQAMAKLMAAHDGGAIVNLTSVTARSIPPGVGIYPASKAAIIALTKQTAIEYAAKGIRANAVGPGFIPTPGTVDTYGADEETQRERGRIVPLGRYGTPDEIADAVAFFASDASRYVTGQVLFVDGGVTEASMLFMFAAQAAQ